MAVPRSLLLLAALLGESSGVSLSRSRANPIRKVVNMLKAMDKKVEAEGKQSQQLFDKYMCYCSNTAKELDGQIADAEEKIPQLESSIKETEEAHAQLLEALKKHKQDRTEARGAIATATALREKNAASFAAESTRVKANIAALAEAIAALTRGMGGGFLQTNAASVLRQLSVSMDMTGSDRDLLGSFLSEGIQGADTQEYAPSGGEINGILKQLKETMEGDLADLTSAEESDTADSDALVAAKKKEVQAANEAIEEKTGRVGDLAVEITTLKADLEDTEDGLTKDKDFGSNLAVTCTNKKAKWEVYTKLMGEERLAIVDTIKVLNDDDALDLFKKTLPGPEVSLLELAGDSTATDLRKQASAVLRRKRHADPRLDLVQMAIRGEAKGFAALIGKVDVLVGVLNQEQKEDDQKKVYCEGEIDKTEDEKKVGDRAISDRKTAIEQSEGELEAVTEDIQKLVNGIRQMDAEVEEQTLLRKEKHSQIVETLAANNAARGLLDVAKNRLAKFYNPTLHKAAPKRELSEEDRIVVNNGGTAPPTPAPGGIAGTGISAASSFLQVASDTSAAENSDASDGAADNNAAAHEVVLDYKKEGEAHAGVLAMLDLLRSDLSKQIVQMEEQDKEAQKDYEQFIKDSSDKRKIDSKAVAAKEGAKADVEATIQKQRGALRSEQSNVKGTLEELSALHQSCDWLLANHELRKSARADETEALQKAKAVLAGADYS